MILLLLVLVLMLTSSTARNPMTASCAELEVVPDRATSKPTTATSPLSASCDRINPTIAVQNFNAEHVQRWRVIVTSNGWLLGSLIEHPGTTKPQKRRQGRAM